MPSLRELRSRPSVRKGSIAAVSALAAYTLFGFFGLPAILKSQLPRTLEPALHRKVSVREVRANPFVLSVTVRGLEISERDSPATWISVGEIYANLQLASVLRGGPVLRELRIARPHATIVRNADGSYNFSDLIEKTSTKSEQKSKQLKYSLNNIEIVGGSIDFDDRPKDTRHAVRDIRIAIPFLSNLKYHVNRYVQPAFSATINGDNVALNGRTKPFEESLESVFDVDIRRLDIPHYLPYLPVRRQFDVPSALLDLKAAVSFAQRLEGPPSVRVDGTATLRQVRVTAKDGSPMISLPSVEAVISPADIGAREFRLAALTVREPEIDVAIDQNKKLNLLLLLPENKGDDSPSPQSAEDVEKGAAMKEAVFSVDAFRLEGGKVRFSDVSRPRPFRTALEKIELAVERLSTEKGKAADAALSLSTEAGERVSANGTISLLPLVSEGTVAVEKAVLGKYAPYYMDAVRFDVERGTLDVRTSYRFAQGAEGPELTLSGLSAGLAGLRLRHRDEGEPFLTIQELSVREMALDLGRKEVAIGEFTTRNGALSVRTATDGKINVAQLLAEGAPATPSAVGAPAPDEKAGSPAKPWVLSLKKASVDRYAAQFDDRTTDPPVQISIDRFRLQGRNLSTQRDRKGTFSLSMVYNRTGEISLSGDLTVDPLSMKAKIRATALPIGVTQPYYTSRVKIVLTGGDYSVDGALSVDAPRGKPLRAEYRGDMFLRNFSSLDKERSEDFLKFDTLHFAGVEAAYNPARVSIREISLSEFYSRVIVNADGTLNLQGIVAKAEADNTAGSPGTAAPPRGGAERPEPVPVRIDAVTLQGGNVNFSDRFIRPNYSANLVGIGGRVTGLSSDPDVLADVDLRGSLGTAAPIEILGKINPLAETLYLDLKASIDDIDLSPLTPYSGRYAGYAIEKGKLSLALKYHIEKEKLQAENKVFLDQFTFGESVDSPDATKLPVRLAVALLKDRNGEIHLDIPVSGDLSDPEFRVLGVVWKIIRNLLVKVATAPFALLGAMFGGGGEQLSYVEFGYGLAAVPEDGTPKITALAKMLQERPGIRLEIEGHADPEQDREALRQLIFRRKLATLKAEDLANAGQPVPALDNVRIEPAEYEKYLTRAYRKETFPKPRTFLGTAKALPVPEMEKLMMANIRATDDDLRRLAGERAEAVRGRLVAAGGVDPGKIFLVQPKSLAPEKKEKVKDSRADLRIR